MSSASWSYPNCCNPGERRRDDDNAIGSHGPITRQTILPRSRGDFGGPPHLNERVARAQAKAHARGCVGDAPAHRCPCESTRAARERGDIGRTREREHTAREVIRDGVGKADWSGGEVRGRGTRRRLNRGCRPGRARARGKVGRAQEFEVGDGGIGAHLEYGVALGAQVRRRIRGARRALLRQRAALRIPHACCQPSSSRWPRSCPTPPASHAAPSFAARRRPHCRSSALRRRDGRSATPSARRERRDRGQPAGYRAAPLRARPAIRSQALA